MEAVSTPLLWASGSQMCADEEGLRPKDYLSQWLPGGTEDPS